jgi:hypothetical protein
MRIRRRSLRKGLVAVGCLVGHVSFPAAALGGVSIGLGAALHLWSKGCLEQNRRLTRAGPYRFTRNPFYLANGLVDLGLCLAIGSPWLAIVYWPIWWLSYRETILREEARLAALFPETYPAYRAAVPRLLPTGRGLAVTAARGRFDLDNPSLARGAEYARVLGIAIQPGAIWAAEVLRVERFAALEPGREWLLAGILMVPAAWVLKLALAETFRRPGTHLLPGIATPGRWIAVIGSLAIMIASSLGGAPWLSVAAALWLGILLLDAYGDERGRGRDTEGRGVWAYFPAAFAGTLVSVTGLWLMIVRPEGLGG